MPSGDTDDMAGRIRSVLPSSWFPRSPAPGASATPVLDGVLAGLGSAWAALYSLLSYTRLQTRIATATDFFLDLIAADFFGVKLQRRSGEADSAFRNRIEANIFAPRATRAAVSAALRELTGQLPIIFEPAYTPDTGGYGVPAQGGGNLGYGVAGGWGSLELPFQYFVTAFRPVGVVAGVANVAGYGSLGASDASPGGYGAGAFEYADMELVSGTVLDSDIYAAIATTRPVATIAWASIANPPPRLPLSDESGAALTDETTDPFYPD